MNRRDEIATQLGQMEMARAALLAELVALHLERDPEDRLLKIEDAASLLAVTTDWLYRHADTFTFTIRPGPGQVRFSHLGLQEYLRKRR